MSEELDVLKVVTRRLLGANMPYMITGSIAANYYTIPRMTRDIDVVVELNSRQIDRFVKLFEKDFYLDRQMIEDEVLRQGMFNLIHNQYVIKVDFIVRKESEFQNSTFARRIEVLIENRPMWFISAEDLALAKLLWAKHSHSEIQLNDVHNLLETVDNLDVEYIEKWVSRLGLKETYQNVKL